MSEDTVRASARIDAPSARVYGIIADYHNGHPYILPKQFRNLVVEAAGITTFTVDPAEGGRACDVTIETRLETKPGILGSIERAMSSRFLRSLYREELALLAAKARTEHKGS